MRIADQKSVQNVNGSDCGRGHSPHGLESERERHVGIREVADEPSTPVYLGVHERQWLAARLEEGLKRQLEVLCRVALHLPDENVQQLNGLDTSGLHPVADVVQNGRNYFARIQPNQLTTA